MVLIDFTEVDLVYPVRDNRGLTLKDLVLGGIFQRPSVRRWKSVHALRGVTFRIDDGERVGIIGRNGASKSTLLRTIGGVYPVQGGRRRVEGSIGSLFDLTLGFEPAATGRDNIRYRGYLQGETPRTIETKIRQVAEFAALGDAIDLPLNCYSSGMIMRLGFAIAASAEPEILLVDEVFAAGDLVFRAKAEARMRQLRDRARIVVMVGHNLDMLQEFCTRILWLREGRVCADGPPEAVVAQYREEAAIEALAA